MAYITFLCFISFIPVHFFQSAIEVSDYYLVFISLSFVFYVSLQTLKEAPPNQLFPVTMTWRSIDTKNSDIRGSNFKGHKLPFWICVNIWHQSLGKARWECLLKKCRQGRKKLVLANYFLSDGFVPDLYEFQLKWRYPYSDFCKIQVQFPASLDLWCHQHWRRVCCNHWTIKKERTGSLDQF